MPKVSHEYFAVKRQAIINAAIDVCIHKPVYQVTMKDIIEKAGLSKGGIYLYFSDVDDILIEVINSFNPKADYRNKIDDIISGSESVDGALQNLFVFLGEYMGHIPPIAGKFQFELTILYTSHPERAQKILSKITDQQSGQYFNGQIYSVIEKGIKSGQFHPSLPINEVMAFVSASIDGIVLNQVLFKYYHISSAAGQKENAVSMMKLLAESLMAILKVHH